MSQHWNTPKESWPTGAFILGAEGCLDQVYCSQALWGVPACQHHPNQVPAHKSASPSSICNVSTQVSITFLYLQCQSTMLSTGESKMGFKLTTQANRQQTVTRIYIYYRNLEDKLDP